jgi:hypothetical protein
MALEAGSCTINADGTVTGTGLAHAVATEYVTRVEGLVLKRPAVREAYEQLSEAIAAAVVGYLLANADISVTVKTTDGGLQRDPASSDPTLAPSTDKTITGSLT